MALPSKQQILDWVAENPDAASKRDIAKAFNVKGSDKIELKRLLKELAEDGRLERRRKSYRDAERLPPVTVLQLQGPDEDGDMFARPLEYRGEGPVPRILYQPRQADPALGQGDRILARLIEVKGEDHDYIARLIRRIGETRNRIVGIYRKRTEGGRILPIDKGSDREWQVRDGDSQGAEDGELVEAERDLALPLAREVREERDRLHRLAQPHLVREHAVDTVAVEEREPVQPD